MKPLESSGTSRQRGWPGVSQPDGTIWSAVTAGGWRRAMLMALLALSVAVSGPQASPAAAQEIDIGCLPGEDPCIKVWGKSPTHITLVFSENDRSDEHHIRWSEFGRPEQTATVSAADFFAARRLRPDTWYRFAVQRCEKVLIGKDNCTGWSVKNVKTPRASVE
jgi:hypothetical protein